MSQLIARAKNGKIAGKLGRYLHLLRG